jgi:two-component system NtrC family sensor kinase
MKDYRKKLATILLKKADAEADESLTLLNRYKQFRVSLLVVITIIAMLPATVISILGYFQYLVRLENQELQHLSWHLKDSTTKLDELIKKGLLEQDQLPDSTILQKLAKSNNPQTDAFLIDKEGKLLTTSLSYGQIGDIYPLNQYDSAVTTYAEKKPWGSGITFYGISHLDQAPWSLVLVKDGPIGKEEWSSFQTTLLITFLCCFFIGLFVIFQLVAILTSRIRESDSKRMSLITEATHSHRLATIGRFAAGVAHEINNPLSIIDQKAGLIEDLVDFSEDFPHQEKVSLSIIGIHEGVQRCKVITHRLLGFARKMDTRTESIQLNDLLVEVISFLEKEALHNQIRLDLQLNENLPQVESDVGQLQQIFLNIINNGIDAVGLDGEIIISSEQIDEEHIQVTVSDSGPGMDSETLKHIFDPFFTTKVTGEGTGLGLSITYGLIKRLGCKIHVESSVEKGTSFKVIIPRHHETIKNEDDEE